MFLITVWVEMPETAQDLGEVTQDPSYGRDSMNDRVDRAATLEKLVCCSGRVVVD